MGQFFENSLMSKIPDQKENSPMYGVYSFYESDVDGDYTVTVGMEAISSDSASEYDGVNIEGGEYLLFKAKGEMPDVVM
jgi:predicted transcriptional regulator YdeE